MASEMWSHNLSGWSSPTDSEVNRKAIGLLIVGIYDDILFLFNLEFVLYDHDQIFKTRINLDISDGYDKIQQQEQDIVLE